MPRSKRSRSDELHTHLTIKVDRYDITSGSAVNYDLLASHLGWSRRDEPVFVFATWLKLYGVCRHPEDRAGDQYRIEVGGEVAGESQWKVKNTELRDENNAPVYRTYRGVEEPTYRVTKGIGLLERVRGKREWTLWFR